MRRILLSLFTCMCAAGAMATPPVDVQQQKLEKSHHIAMFGDGKPDSAAVSNLVSQFYIDQFRHAQDPRAPYFMLMSRDASMAMGIGGTVQVLAFYDWHGPFSGSDFAPYEIPIPADPGRPNMFQTTIGQSALFFTMFGNSSKFGRYRFYVEAKFKGGGDSHFFKLNKAYATVGDWTLGLATTTFADPASQPTTIETQGPNSEIGLKRVLLRYVHELRKNWTVALSMESPNDAIAPDTDTYEAGSSYIPNFAGFVQYGTQSQHVRLSGIIKGMRYRNLVEDKNAYATGWGVSLSGVFRPAPPVTVFANANYGHGIGSLINDLSLGNFDLMGLASKPGKMYAPRSYGWYAAVQYNFRPNLYSTLIFSQTRLLPKKGSGIDGDQYKYGLYGVANILWEITPRCTIGAEFDLGKRVNIDGAHRSDYRCNLLAQFNF